MNFAVGTTPTAGEATVAACPYAGTAMRLIAFSRFAGIALAACLSLASPARAAESPAALTAEQAQRELRILERGLTDLHAGLYRYRTPEQIRAEFARAEAEVANGSDALQMYLIASRIAATVRCGHTWTNPLNQGAAVQAALAALPAPPLRVRLLEGRLLVTASVDPRVPADAEILSIDGRTPAALVAEFLPYLRADGGNDGKRLSQLDSDENGGALERLLPLLHPPGADGYRMRLRENGHEVEVVVPGLPVTERERRLAAAGAAQADVAWRFVIDGDGDTATLTMPTFAFWNDDFDWRGFLDRSFATLEAKKIPFLILDLRRNEGGDSDIGRALIAHLLTAPYTPPATRSESAYERAPYALARFLDTWDFSFFDRTGQVTRGPGRNWLLPDAAAQRIEPVAKPYRGLVVALTGPRMSSAGYLVARDLKASGAATLIGGETGGNLRGLNGGQLAWLVLPTSGVSVDIPLLAHVTAGDAPDRGVLPDIAVRTRLEDVVAGIDPDRAAAERWFAERASSTQQRADRR